MTTTPGFLDYVCDVLAGLGPVQARRMFGGAGIYLDGVMFGLVADDVLYLKADKTTQKRFEAEGMEPFTYEGKSKPVRMSYWRVPDRLFDDNEDMLEWSRLALKVASKAKSSVGNVKKKMKRKNLSKAKTLGRKNGKK